MSTAKTKKEKRENAQLKQILIPELVVVHPFPASLWRKTVTLPCILYRLNSLFLADQLRRKIARDIKLCSRSYEDVTTKWPPLDFGWTLAEVLAQQQEEADGRSHSRFSMHDDLDDEDDDIEIRHRSHQNYTAKSKSKTKRPTHQNKKGSKPRLPSISSNEEPPDFIIDTFDPEKYAVPDVDDYDEVMEDEHMWKDIDMMSVIKGGVIELGGLNQTLGPIGTWDKETSNPHSNDKTFFEKRPKIIELPDDAESGDIEPKANGNSHQPRVGSPSNFDHLSQEEDEDGKPWGENTEDGVDHGNFIDVGMTSGVSKISAVGINIEGLCQDLTKGRVFEDDYDSDDSIVEEDDEDVEFTDIPLKKTEEANSLKRNKKQKVESVNEILDHGILGPSVPAAVDPEEADISSILDDTIIEDEFENLKIDTSKQLSPKSKVKKELDSILEELTHDALQVASDHAQSPMPNNQDDSMHLETNFGELLPKHRRQEMQEENGQIPQLDGLSIKFDALKSGSDSLIGPSPCVILQALTMSNASDGINLERLETVGDSFLKYAVTLYLYCMCPSIHEGKLSYLRSRQISNYNLYRLGKRKGLGDYIIGCKFEPSDNWLPPGYIVPKGLEEALVDLGSPSLSYDLGELRKIENLDNLTPEEVKNEILKRKEHFVLSTNPDGHDAPSHFNTFLDVDNSIRIPYNLLSQQSIPDKSIADCVEALIGAYLLYSSPKGALLFMNWLGLKVMPATTEGIEKWPEDDEIWHHLPPVKSPLQVISPDDPDFEVKTAFQKSQLDRLYSGSGLDRFEREILQYEFRDKSYLIQAFTHNSYFENQITDCYQRLEFLGDAILDFLVTRLLYEDPRKHSPGVLTDLRSALVNNTFFASLAIEYKFHKYLKNLSHDLLRVKTDFVEKFNAKFYRDSLDLYIAEGESENLDDVEVPKALGDVFESVAGAIFLDSGMSLDAVWRVYYRMMKPEIEHFSNNVPKSPIRELLEMEPQNAQFGKPEVIPGKKIRVCVEIFGEGKFTGIGRNKRIAKCTAAKRALRSLRPKRPQQVQ
jgi:endoribonuclease Dicer